MAVVVGYLERRHICVRGEEERNIALISERTEPSLLISRELIKLEHDICLLLVPTLG